MRSFSSWEWERPSASATSGVRAAHRMKWPRPVSYLSLRFSRSLMEKRRIPVRSSSREKCSNPKREQKWRKIRGCHQAEILSGFAQGKPGRRTAHRAHQAAGGEKKNTAETSAPLAEVVENPPDQEKPLDEKADEKNTEEKKEIANGAGEETRMRAEADTRPSKPWTKASGYTIQVVSVKKFDVALRVVRKLRDAGLQPFIKNADLGARGKWYRVRVGHYRDKAEAQKALSGMRVRIKLQGARITAL